MMCRESGKTLWNVINPVGAVLKLAKETLDQGEIMAYRSLVDVAERLTNVAPSGISSRVL